MECVALYNDVLVLMKYSVVPYHQRFPFFPVNRSFLFYVLVGQYVSLFLQHLRSEYIVLSLGNANFEISAVYMEYSNGENITPDVDLVLSRLSSSPFNGCCAFLPKHQLFSFLHWQYLFSVSSPTKTILSSLTRQELFLTYFQTKTGFPLIHRQSLLFFLRKRLLLNSLQTDSIWFILFIW